MTDDKELVKLAAPETTTNRLDAELLGLLVDSVKDYAIFMLDTEGHVVSWNTGAVRLKGYEARQIVGKHFSVFYPREDVEAGKCEHELEVAAREGRFEDEGWRIRQDGSTFWANVVITAVRDDQGRLRGFGKVTRDLTTRVEAEAERIRRARAEEGERRKEEFVAIMGHELRNPLAPMLTAVHMIKLRRGANCEREIATLDRQLVQMMRLLDDLLDVSRILRDKVKLSKKVLEVGEVLANAVEVAAPLLEQKKHRLRLDIPAEVLLVEVNPERMTQVFANLLNNAAKYTEVGGDIHVRAEGKDDEVDVTIEDTGVGIAPDMLPRIFELFTQVGPVEGRYLGGFGIGLAVARRLVTEHGGEITAASDGLGRGSRFGVRLPRCVGSVGVRPPAPSLHRAPVQRRVLVVDDNEDSNSMLSALLEQLGHEVRTASEGLHALEIAHEFQPHIVFLDLGLPGISGYEVARRLRQTPTCATIPIYAVSGYARDQDRLEAMSAGFTEHFAKPIDLTKLEDLVERS